MSIVVHIDPLYLKMLAGWCGIIAGLALFAWLIILGDRRSARLAAAAKAKIARARCPQRDWKLMADIVRAGFAQAEAAGALHTRAAERIDAAEYAFNRLLAECASIMGLPNAPAPRPVPVLARRSAPYQARLAA